jgi:hypothetical protein
MQLTEAEAAFRIQKTELQLQPIWHQKKERVQAHILVCFLAFVLWKTLAQLCQRAGLGHEPRKVFEELADITLVDVVLPTRNGVTIRKRCISRATEHQVLSIWQVLPTEVPPVPSSALFSAFLPLLATKLATIPGRPRLKLNPSESKGQIVNPAPVREEIRAIAIRRQVASTNQCR